MVDYTKMLQSEGNELNVPSVTTWIFQRVFLWMTVGLSLSGGIAWYTAKIGLLQQPYGIKLFIGAVIAELVLVLVLSACLQKLSEGVCYLLFLLYSALNGFSLSGIFMVYAASSIQMVFLMTAGMFAGMAVFSLVTKRDLSHIGSICGMALWGILIALIVNIFLGSARLDFAISLVAVVVFCGLTLWDVQKIKMMAMNQATMDGMISPRKLAIFGALTLYLDFVNLFLHLLRLFGKRR